MILTADKLKELSHGAVRVSDEQGKIRLYRFTEEQQLLYKNAGNEALYLKTFTTAGIRITFKTNSTSLYMRLNIPFATTRGYFSADVCVNGKMIGCICNYNEAGMVGLYTKLDYPIGNFEGRFDLGDGEKTVTVYLPWSVPVEIEEFSIDDGSFTEPVPRDKKLLAFGDSITQGYDTIHPSNHYIPRLADYLSADVYNKAIGAEKFVPSLVDTDEDFVPDYIIAAYGTNDWARSELDVFRKSCSEFYEKLGNKYPSSKIFAITPIWRKDMYEVNKCGGFLSVSDYIEEVTSKFDNIRCIRGFDFVPKEEALFGDLRLHPSDSGFAHYADSLISAIKDLI